MNVRFVPKADVRVYSSSVASNKFNSIFGWPLEKNIDRPVATVTGYNSIPAALLFTRSITPNPGDFNT